jgi:hypothetical protein
MSVFDGNGYFFSSYIVTSTVSNTQVTQSIISESSINMLDINGNYQNIINVKDPINPQDAATKFYVDKVCTIFNVDILDTTPTLLSSNLKGSFIITVSNNVMNGPSAIFHITKSSNTQNAGIARTVSAPGLTYNTQLYITWPVNDGIYIHKSDNFYNGNYTIKFI